MEPVYVPPKQSPRRRIPIANADFGYGNLEAWYNVIRSYCELHPEHKVVLFYEGEPVQSATYLFKLGKAIKHDAFEMAVAARDQDFKHVAKLFRLLVEGSGADYRKFLGRELHRTMKLF